MKDASLGDKILWGDKPAKIIGEIHTKVVIIEPDEEMKCEHCGCSLGKNHIWAAVSYPFFQNNSKQFLLKNT